MIKVTVRNNLKKVELLVSEDKTVKQALNEAGVDLASARVHLDGSPLSVAEMNMTFAQLNVKEDCFLTSVVKTDNA